jgi:hypothetical protein
MILDNLKPTAILFHVVMPFLSHPFHFLRVCKHIATSKEASFSALTCLFKLRPKLIFDATFSADGGWVFKEHSLDRRHVLVLLKSYFHDRINQDGSLFKPHRISDEYWNKECDYFKEYRRFFPAEEKLVEPTTITPTMKMSRWEEIFESCDFYRVVELLREEGITDKYQILGQDFKFLVKAMKAFHPMCIRTYMSVLCWHLLSYDEIMEIFYILLERFRYCRDQLAGENYTNYTASRWIIVSPTIYEVVQFANDKTRCFFG